MLPCLSNEISENELKQLILSIRRCDKCGHAFEIGKECPFCSGKVERFNKHERKPLPVVFLDPKCCEKVIDLNLYDFPVENFAKLEEEGIIICDDDVIPLQKARKIKPEPIEKKRKKCEVNGCNNWARPSQYTCSPLCTLRISNAYYENGKLHLLSKEKAQKILDRQKKPNKLK